jgi:hypothetical protein
VGELVDWVDDDDNVIEALFVTTDELRCRLAKDDFMPD